MAGLINAVSLDRSRVEQVFILVGGLGRPVALDFMVIEDHVGRHVAQHRADAWLAEGDPVAVAEVFQGGGRIGQVDVAGVNLVAHQEHRVDGHFLPGQLVGHDLEQLIALGRPGCRGAAASQAVGVATGADDEVALFAWVGGRGLEGVNGARPVQLATVQRDVVQRRVSAEPAGLIVVDSVVFERQQQHHGAHVMGRHQAIEQRLRPDDAAFDPVTNRSKMRDSCITCLAAQEDAAVLRGGMTNDRADRGCVDVH